MGVPDCHRTNTIPFDVCWLCVIFFFSSFLNFCLSLFFVSLSRFVARCHPNWMPANLCIDIIYSMLSSKYPMCINNGFGICVRCALSICTISTTFYRKHRSDFAIRTRSRHTPCYLVPQFKHLKPQSLVNEPLYNSLKCGFFSKFLLNWFEALFLL